MKSDLLSNVDDYLNNTPVDELLRHLEESKIENDSSPTLEAFVRMILSDEEKHYHEDLLNKSSKFEFDKTEFIMLVSARIDDLRIERGWSKSELATKLGKKSGEITRLLSGTQNLTLDTLFNIANVFQVHPYQILMP